jgi:hypothetical protein
MQLRVGMLTFSSASLLLVRMSISRLGMASAVGATQLSSVLRWLPAFVHIISSAS